MWPRIQQTTRWAHFAHQLHPPTSPPSSYNLSQLEDWARANRLGGTEVLSQLLPSVEAAKLLQMKKSTAKDAESICELCTHLNPLQVRQHVHNGVWMYAKCIMV